MDLGIRWALPFVFVLSAAAAERAPMEMEAPVRKVEPIRQAEPVKPPRALVAAPAPLPAEEQGEMRNALGALPMPARDFAPPVRPRVYELPPAEDLAEKEPPPPGALTLNQRAAVALITVTVFLFGLELWSYGSD